MGFHGCTRFPANSTKNTTTFCYQANDYYN